MAGTIDLNWSINPVNGEDQNRQRSHSDSIAQTNQGSVKSRVATSTTAAALTIPTLTGNGIAILENLSETVGENIDIGPQSDGGTIEDFLTLKPGEKFPIRLKSSLTTIWHQADAGTPILQIEINEN
jgi:hypothetical protein